MIRQFMINNIDLVALGYTVPEINIEEENSLYDQSLVFPITDIKIFDKDNALNPLSPQGMFYGDDFSKYTVKAIDENDELIFIGLIKNIEYSGNRELVLKLENYNSKLLEYVVQYITDETNKKTPAYVAYELLLIHGMKDLIDQASFFTADAFQRSQNYYISVTVVTEQVTLVDLLSKLAFYSCADLYFSNNKIYFQLWRFDSKINMPMKIFNETELLESISIVYINEYMKNDYQIKIKGSSTDIEQIVTDEYFNDIGKDSRGQYGKKSLTEFNLSSDSSPIYLSSTSEGFLAVENAAENWIKRLKDRKIQVEFTIETNKHYRYQLNDLVQFNFENPFYEIDLLGKLFRIKNISISNLENTTKIIGLEEVYTYGGVRVIPPPPPPPPAHITTFPPVHHWKLQETTGTVVEDFGTGLYNLTNSNATVNQAFGLHKSYSFNGATSYLGTMTPPLSDNEFSIAFWVKNETNSGIRCIMDNAHNPCYSFLMQGEGLIGGTLYYFRPSCLGEFLVFYLDENIETHVVITRNATKTYVYINDIQVVDWTNLGAITFNSADGLDIGRRRDASGYFIGKLKDIRYYDYELTTTEIANIFNGGDGTLITW